MEKVTIETMNGNILNLARIVQAMKEDLEDRFLTAEEAKNIIIAEKELAEGKTISLEDMKVQLEL